MVLCYTGHGQAPYAPCQEERIITIRKRTVGLLAGALVVFMAIMVTCSLTASQIVARRSPATYTPTRTARPTWTPVSAGLVMATPTIDRTRFPAPPVPTQAQAQPATPQVIVPGAVQGLVVPAAGTQGVQTVVVIIVTATPLPPPTALPAGPTPTPGPTSTPAPPPPTPTATMTPQPPVIVRVRVDKANVRQGPGGQYPAVTQLDTGTTVTVVGRNRAGDWWKICCVNGGDVWIADAVVTVEGALWTVAEITNIPTPPPLPTATPAPFGTRSPTPTPTSAFQFRLEVPPLEYFSGQNYFRVVAVIYNGTVPLWNYKLRIRKLSTGQEWISVGSDTTYGCERLAPERITPVPVLPCFGPDLKFNVKWDSNGMSVPMGDDVWEVTAINSSGFPESEPVRLNTSVANAKWYYLIFTMK